LELAPVITNSKEDIIDAVNPALDGEQLIASG
jgi:hypothetical protein